MKQSALYYTFTFFVVLTTSGNIFGWPVLESNAALGKWPVAEYLHTAYIIVLMSYTLGGLVILIFVMRPLLDRIGRGMSICIYGSVVIVSIVLLITSLRICPILIYPAILLMGASESVIFALMYTFTDVCPKINVVITIGYSISTATFQLTSIPIAPELSLILWIVPAAVFTLCLGLISMHYDGRLRRASQGTAAVAKTKTKAKTKAEAVAEAELVTISVSESKVSVLMDDEDALVKEVGAVQAKSVPSQGDAHATDEATARSNFYREYIRSYFTSLRPVFRQPEVWLSCFSMSTVTANQSYYFGSLYTRISGYTPEQHKIVSYTLTAAQVATVLSGFLLWIKPVYANIIFFALLDVFALSLFFESNMYTICIFLFIMTIGATGAITCNMQLIYETTQRVEAEAASYLGLILGNAIGSMYLRFSKVTDYIIASYVLLSLLMIFLQVWLYHRHLKAAAAAVAAAAQKAEDSTSKQII